MQYLPYNPAIKLRQNLRTKTLSRSAVCEGCSASEICPFWHRISFRVGNSSSTICGMLLREVNRRCTGPTSPKAKSARTRCLEVKIWARGCAAQWTSRLDKSAHNPKQARKRGRRDGCRETHEQYTWVYSAGKWAKLWRAWTEKPVSRRWKMRKTLFQKHILGHRMNVCTSESGRCVSRRRETSNLVDVDS